MERSLTLEIGNSEYLEWQCHFGSSTGTSVWSSFFFFFFLLLLKGQIVNIWGSVGLQLLNFATAEWKLPLTVPTKCVWWCFSKTLDRNKADLIPCQSLLTLALEKLWNFTFIFFSPSPLPFFLKAPFICVVQISSYQIHIYMFMCVCAQSCLTLCDSMNYIACQAPLYMEFSRQKYWSG